MNSAKKRIAGGLVLAVLSYSSLNATGSQTGYESMKNDFGAYHTFEEVEREIFLLKEKYPDIITIHVMGTSWQKRSLYAVTISDQDKNKTTGKREEQVIIQSGMHARELIPVEVSLYTMKNLVENYQKNEFITNLVDNKEIIFIPVLNPDGLKKYEEIIESKGVSTWESWRKNCRDNNRDGKIEDYMDGVDLNRNFSVDFGGNGASSLVGSQIYHGPRERIDNDKDGKIDEDLLDYKDNDGDGKIDEDTAGGFTEPETIAYKNFVDSLDNLVSALDLHSCSGLIMWPNGFSPEKTKDDAVFSAIAQKMRELQSDPYRIGDIYHTIYPVSGDICDWLYHEKNVLAMTIEIYKEGEDDDKGKYGVVAWFNPLPENIHHHFINNYAPILYFIAVSENHNLKPSP